MTDITIEVTRSDFVVDKKNCETVIIDVAVPADFSVIDKERKKYQILVIEIYFLLLFPFLVCSLINFKLLHENENDPPLEHLLRE